MEPPDMPVPGPAVALGPDPVWRRPPDRRSLAQIHAVGGPDAGRVWALGPGVHTIGSAPLDTVKVGDGRLPAAAIRLTVTALGEVWLTVDAHLALEPGVRDTAAVRWPAGEDVLVGDVVLRLAGDCPTQPGASGPAAAPDRIRYPRPPAPPRPNLLSWPVVFAPLLIGMGPGLLLRLPAFLGLTLLTPVFAVVHWRIGRRDGRRAFRIAMADYRIARWAAEDAVRAARLRERTQYREAAIDPARAALAAIDCGPGLWARGPVRSDSLRLRIGTSDQPSAIAPADPADPAGADGARRILRAVPHCVDLAECGVLGVAGEAETARGLARWLVLQAAVRRDPGGLRIHLVAGLPSVDGWSWLGRLAHTGPPGVLIDSRTLVAADPVRVVQRIGYLLALIDARKASRRVPDRLAAGPSGAGGRDAPEHLVVLDGAGRLREVDGVARILEQGPGVGVFVLCIDAFARMLPQECRAVVRCESGLLAVRGGAAAGAEGIRPDLVTAAWCDRVARALAPARQGPAPMPGGRTAG
jgi:DNA segregation ATPase FtsK/SpoIIIE, S-DNA-T family